MNMNVKNEKLVKLSVPKLANQRLRTFMASNGCFHKVGKLLGDFTAELDVGKGKNPDEKFCLQFEKVAFALGLDTHNPVSESVKERYRYFLIEMIERIELENNCTTALEKSLAETIALSHVRVIWLSQIFDQYTGEIQTCDKDTVNYHNLIGKEIDRTHRQLNNAILTLTQVKTLRTPLNVTAHTAFIAQNQQFNNGDPCEINDRQ